MNSYQKLKTERDEYKKSLDNIIVAAKTGGSVLRRTIQNNGGPPFSLYDLATSNVVTAAVKWCHSPAMLNRSSLTEAERELIGAVDAMLRTNNDQSNADH